MQIIHKLCIQALSDFVSTYGICYMKDDAEAGQQNSVHRQLRSHPSIEAVDMGRM